MGGCLPPGVSPGETPFATRPQLLVHRRALGERDGDGGGLPDEQGETRPSLRSCRDYPDRREGDPPRRDRARARRRREWPRRCACDRPEARRAGRAREGGRRRAGPAPASPGRGETADPDDARHRRPGRAPRPAPLRRAPARRGRTAALSGREGRDRPPGRERLLLRLRVPGADQRRRPRADRGRGAARARRGPLVVTRGDHRRRGAGALRRRGRALQGRARRHRGGSDLALHAGRLHRPLPRPAPAGLEADQGLQAHLARRRVLARGRAQHPADPHLRDGVLQPEGPRRPPRTARAGPGARPPAARSPARPVPLRRAFARLAVLASEGHGDLQHPRGPPAARERPARLLRGEDAAHLRQGPLGDVGPLGQVPREHVPDPGRRRARLRRSSR